jgi:DNA-binding transcriptional regulator LsrR (DeoR family)
VLREMKTQGLGAAEIANPLGIGRASVYRVLEADSRAVVRSVPGLRVSLW